MIDKKILCRNCGNKKLLKLFSLGNLAYSGKFPKFKKIDVAKEEITLVMCSSCKLVQLSKNFNPKFLYSKDYGYRSGINKTMSEHLSKVSQKLSILTNLNKGDAVLDIASNDGTLLNSYKKKGIVKVGIDPIINKFKKFYKKNDYQIKDFFSYKSIIKKKINNKFKIITALAVFYDLKKPNYFLKDIKKLIDKKKGIFVLEFADLLSLVKYNLFDTICHEHLAYYTSKIIIDMVKKNNLKVFDIDTNDINGGSVRFYICNDEADYKINKRNINSYLRKEKKYRLESQKTFLNFFKDISVIKKKVNNIIKKINFNKKTIHGYGASTKGNILLQYFDINNKQIPYIADRNLEKNGTFTPGTKIKIITEKKSRKLHPDYYLVLPWHFKKEILKREKKIAAMGTKFIFPLPNIKIH